MKWLFRHQDLQFFLSQIKQICLIFNHLKLWIAVAELSVSLFSRSAMAAYIYMLVGWLNGAFKKGNVNFDFMHVCFCLHEKLVIRSHSSWCDTY